MDPQDLLERMQHALETADYEGARDLLLNWPPPIPEDAIALLAEVEVALGTPIQLERACARCRNLLKSAQSSEIRSWAQLILGAALSCLGDDAAARPEYEAAFAAHPEWLQGPYGAAYACCLVELEDFDAAEEVLGELPEGDERRVAQTRWFRRQGRARDAWTLLSPRPEEVDPAIAFEATCLRHALADQAGAARWAQRGRSAQRAWFDRALELEPERFRPKV